MAHEHVRKLNAGFIEAAAAAARARDAVKPMTDVGKVFQQAVQRSAAQPSAALQAAMADVGQGLSKIAEQYLGVVRRIGFEDQFGRLPSQVRTSRFPTHYRTSGTSSTHGAGAWTTLDGSLTIPRRLSRSRPAPVTGEQYRCSYATTTTNNGRLSAVRPKLG